MRSRSSSRHRWALLALALAAGCSGPRDANSPGVPSSGGIADYVVTVSRGGRSIDIDATLPATHDPVGLPGRTASFAHDAERESDGAWTSVDLTSHRGVPCGSGCRLRYRFDLAAAASLGDPSWAATASGAVLSPPSSWLPQPRRPVPGYRLRVRGDTAALVTGLPLSAADGELRHETTSNSVDFTPLFAFGPWRVRRLTLGDAAVAVAIEPRAFAMSDDAIAAWVEHEARGVGALFGKYPTSPLLVAVVAPGDGMHGLTLGGGGASVVVPLEPPATAARARGDWVLTHELLHTCFPDVGPPHRWLEEGLSTYVEPLVRARAGDLSPDSLWNDLLRDTPQGLPGSGDRGLEHTATWGRTYWGGAIFWLLADVRARERTGGRRSIDDALRAIAGAGGTVARHWTIDQVIEVGDRALGVPVLRETHTELAAAPGVVDLPALWRRLGVARRPDGQGVTYDDTAPLAAIRRELTRPGAAVSSPP